MTEKKKGGKGNEPWYMSRRMWAVVFTVFSGVVTALVQLGYIPYNIYTAFSPLLTIIAGYLGVQSWIKPKKQ